MEFAYHFFEGNEDFPLDMTASFRSKLVFQMDGCHTEFGIGFHSPVNVDRISVTGYGNAINVYRTVKTYAKLGVAAIHLEDQLAPKRCGHVQGKVLIPLEEMVGKLHAAKDAAAEQDIVIIARTDARAAPKSARGRATSAASSGRSGPSERT